MSQTHPDTAGPAWWQLVWTFVFAAVVAAGFTVIGFVLFASGETAWRNLAGWGHWYLNYLIVSLAIGYTIHGLFVAGRRLVGVERLRRSAAWQRFVYFGGIPLAGTLIGLALGLPLVSGRLGGWRWPTDANGLTGSVLLSVLVWFLFLVYFSGRARRIAAEQRATEARLQLLQAQMEPHFLFNTLANVVGLMDADTPRAKAMLESFTDYLRASLGGLRQGTQTLGAELALVEAYLRVVGVRMGARLRWSVDVPDALRARTVPALSLQPLVENAILHGLEPAIDGGMLTVRAHEAAGLLTLEVEDDGVGLTASSGPTAGAGIALANLRQRLAALGDAHAGLHIAAGAVRGVRATLVLPAPRDDAAPVAPRPAGAAA